MINALTAYTFEMDDVDAAVSEILEQLDLRKNLLKNAVGLLFCYIDFIGSGVVKALSDRLPFDVIGCSTSGALVRGEMDELILSLLVLTSDDVEFSTGASEPLLGQVETSVRNMYRQATAPLTGKPSLAIALQPMLDHEGIGGDVIADALNRASEGVPLFGSIGLHLVGNEFRFSKTVHNGESYGDRVVVLLLSGPVSPRFFLGTIMEKKNFTQKAAITGAEGNRLLSINNMPAVEYVKKIGFSGIDATLYHAVPFLIDSHNGLEPQTFISSDIAPDGILIMSGTLPSSGTLMVGAHASDDVLATAKKLVDSVKETQKENPDRKTLLIFSCASRRTVLYDSRAEMNLIRRELEGSGVSYLFTYSGGEFCPWNDPKSGKEINRFHNFVVIGCLL
ncbi:MAG: hypothetical protein LBJ36_09110 [Synergistaceae bacterium]|jgi:hypothetical protein|nr:hypothetical protein [Synergistaceae bacterium]